MRFPAFVLPALFVCAISAFSQSGFSSKSYPGLHTSGLKTADVNGDGSTDLVTASSVIYNDGSGNFGAPVSFPDNLGFADYAISDMNGDSYPDIVGCQNTGSGDTAQQSFTVLINNGGGNFSAKPPVTAAGACYQLAVGDVYRNGHPAVVAVGHPYYTSSTTPHNNFYVLSNDGSGNLTIAQSSSPNLDQPGATTDYTNCSLLSVVGGDFKHNGNFDLVLTTACNPPVNGYVPAESTFFYAEQGDASHPGYPTFTYQQSGTLQYSNGKAVDLDRNGSLDLVYHYVNFGYRGGPYYGVQYGWNDGTGNFSFGPHGTAPSGGVVSPDGNGDAAIADFNGDTLNDVAITAYNQNTSIQAPPTLTIYSGASGGGYVQSSQTDIGPNQATAGAIVTADFNHDQKPDLATLVYDPGTSSTTLIVLLNIQNGGSAPCTTPSAQDTSVICSPTNGAHFDSGAVSVTAASNVANFVHNRLYLDNQAVFDTDSQTVSTTINPGNGNHHLVLVSWNTAGASFTSSADFSIGAGTTNGCIPNTASAIICSPAAGGSYTSQQITVTAGARAQTGYLTALRVYVDNVAVYTSNNPGQTATYQFTQAIDVNPGAHHMVVVAYQSNGAALTSAVDFTSNPGPCTPDGTTNNVRICSPIPSTPTSSPVIVSAGAHTNSGYLAAMRIYIDNNPVATINTSSYSQSQVIQQSISIPAGTHSMVIVGYPNSGGYVSASETVVIQ